MVIATTPSPASPDSERRLNAFGLSTELIHTALRPGLSRATNRTGRALRSTPGTDIYHDGMEQFALVLEDPGWRLVYVDHQPRLLHPDSVIAFTLASGVNVGNPDRRRVPRTRKGEATRKSLTAPRATVPTLFDAPEPDQKEELVAAATAAPLYLLVHERTPRGLNVELSRPAQMTQSGVVDEWVDRIPIAFLDLDGDLAIFDESGDEGFDVPVEPLR